jgi:hypothetical protein
MYAGTLLGGAELPPVRPLHVSPQRGAVMLAGGSTNPLNAPVKETFDENGLAVCHCDDQNVTAPPMTARRSLIVNDAPVVDANA